MGRFKELEELTIRNRDDLIRKLKDVKFTTPDGRLVSFHVELLFLSIPMKEARGCKEKYAWQRELIDF